MAKKDVNYFDLFIEAAKVCCKAAEQLENLVKGEDNSKNEINTIHNIEREGDELYHTLYDHLNRSFITPIEREDILQTARNIEDTIDTIDEVGVMFNILSISK